MNSVSDKKKPGRPRIYADHAARQRAYMERERRIEADLEHLKEALTRAVERSRTTDLMNHLPDAPGEWLPELTRRLAGKRVIVCDRERKVKKEQSDA